MIFFPHFTNFITYQLNSVTGAKDSIKGEDARKFGVIERSGDAIERARAEVALARSFMNNDQPPLQGTGVTWSQLLSARQRADGLRTIEPCCNH